MAFAFSTTPGVGVGTISIAKNGTTVTGVGTNFQSPSLVNQIILVNGFNSRVTAVASATSMTINRAPSYEITGEAFSFVTAATNINQTGADTDPSGLSALIGVNTYRVGIQAVYDLGVMRLALTGAAAVFSYDANLHCIVWNNQITEPELTVGSGRTLTITGARTDGTYTAPFYPRAMAMPRVLPGDSTFLPDRRAVANSGTLNLSGVWFDTNQVQQMTGTVNITDIKWSATNQGANFRLNSSGVTINGMDLYNMPLTVIAAPAALNGMKFYKSDYTPVSLPAVAPTNPRIYTNWNFQGALPLMNNFSGNANYVEFVNFGDWDGFKLATNSAVNMAARFTKAVSVSVTDAASAPITGAIVYRLDTNNGSRVTYTTDEHFIQTTASGAASGKILAQVGRLPTGAATNSTQYTATMDYRNAANNGTGADVLRYVSYPHLMASRAINTKGTGGLAVEQILFADPNVTLSAAAAASKLASSFTVNATTKVVTVTANSTYDDVYDALKAYKATANAVNLAAPTLDTLIVTPNGTQLIAAATWTLVVNSGVTLSDGAKFNFIRFDTVTLNGTITGVYQTSAGTSTVLELREIKPGAAYMAMNNTTKATLLYGTNATASPETYRLYLPPGSAGTPVYVARQAYGDQFDFEVFTLVTGTVWYQFVDIPDEGITEATLATVNAYTTIENTNKLYDRVVAFRMTEAGIKLGGIVTRAGPLLQFGDYSGVVDQAAASAFSITGDVITIKANGLEGTSKYTTIVADPPATWEADTNEVISVEIEDANGDSSVTISASGVSTFEIWKIADAVDPDDYATGTLLDTVGTGKYRFIGAAGFKMVIRDTTTNFRVVSEMEKGTYQAALFFGAAVQLAQAPTVDLIYTNQQEMQVSIDAIQGSGFTTTTNSLVAITAALDAIPADLEGLNVNVEQMNGADVIGDGSEADPWRGVGVDP
jgi:hypothetical protein